MQLLMKHNMYKYTWRRYIPLFVSVEKKPNGNGPLMPEVLFERNWKERNSYVAESDAYCVPIYGLI